MRVTNRHKKVLTDNPENTFGDTKVGRFDVYMKDTQTTRQN